MKYLILILCLLVTGCSSDTSICRADQIIIGMSEEDLLATCGNANKNHVSNGSTQWVYRGNENLFVYTENGKVRSKQWSDYK